MVLSLLYLGLCRLLGLVVSCRRSESDRTPRSSCSSEVRILERQLHLAHQSFDILLGGFTTILRGCKTMLRPGGFVVVTARPWRRAGELVDLPAAVLACAEDAGLIAYEANVALLTGLRGDSLVPSVSFFQLEHVRKARAAGTLHLAIAHEDILVLRNPI